MAATAEEEAIIKYRYLTQTVTTAAHVLPPLKSLAKRCVSPDGIGWACAGAPCDWATPLSEPSVSAALPQVLPVPGGASVWVSE